MSLRYVYQYAINKVTFYCSKEVGDFNLRILGTPFSEIGPKYEMVEPAPEDSHDGDDKIIIGIAPTFEKLEANPVRMELYYDALAVPLMHNMIFPAWKYLYKSGKKCILHEHYVRFSQFY